MKELVGALVQLGQDLPVLAWIYGFMYASRELLRRGAGRSTALGRWLARSRPPERPGQVVFEDPEEAAAFRLLAESLVQRLGLRSDSQDEVLAELGRERELVLAWLVHESRSRERGGAAAAGPDAAGPDAPA